MEVNVPVKRFCDEARQFKGFTEKTIRRYRTTVELFCRQMGILRIEDIDAAIVREWFFRGRADRAWSVATFRTYYKSLKVFFRWCRKQRWLEGDPLADLALPKEERRLPPRLTLQEAMRLLEITHNYPWSDSFVRYRNHGIIATFLFAGLRKSEALNLRVADVDLENLTIFIRRGKGKKDRIVPVSETLAEILARYAEERLRRRKACPEFFTKHGADAGFTDEGLRRVVSILRESSGLSFTVHQLRHTFATLMLEGGCDIYSLSRMMGHEDIKTTTIYLAASAEHLRAQMTKHPLGNGAGNAGTGARPARQQLPRALEAWEPDEESCKPSGLSRSYSFAPVMPSPKLQGRPGGQRGI